NRYANAGSPLRGCGNDAALTQRLLEERGYAPILILKDSQATEAGIRAALKSLASAAGPGDYVYVHFSGYGNTDSAGPVLCPHDYVPDQHGIAYTEILQTVD